MFATNDVTNNLYIIIEYCCPLKHKCGDEWKPTNMKEWFFCTDDKGQDVKWMHIWYKRENWLQLWCGCTLGSSEKIGCKLVFFLIFFALNQVCNHFTSCPLGDILIVKDKHDFEQVKINDIMFLDFATRV
jgi:hypothetical protein